MINQRYSRQIVLPQVGEAGQEKIGNARIAVLGVGSLGTVQADLLTRLGVGFLRLADRDYVSETNIARSALFTAADARQSTPKAVAAANILANIESETIIDPQVTDINAQTIDALISDVDIVLDGSDNYEVRYLINEACHALGKTWIHGGALAFAGGAMVVKPEGPCIRCLQPDIPTPGSYPTCASAGVVNITTQLVAALQVTEALKLILGIKKLTGDVSLSTFGSEEVDRETSPVNFVNFANYISLDVLTHEIDTVAIAKDPECLTCSLEQYEFYGQPVKTQSTDLCGRDEFQVRPASQQQVDLTALAAKLRALGAVTVSPFLLSFDNGSLRFKLFADGRAMIKGVSSAEAALSTYADYIGL
ncbi:thiamine/molybdopterin biosynthesis protein MoeB [Actinomycetota bacterium]|nr:thiamine/molybdopterin biosynthesis protein MoeB [Actinomycetota bacterium]